MRVTYQVLGPITARVDSRPLAIGGPKQRALLAALVLEPGRPVPLERLLGLLWHEPPRSAVANLRTYAAGLRRSLGDRVVARNGGYALAAEPEDCDLAAFRRAVTDARALRDHGDLESARGRFDEALALWQGECGADLPVDLPLRARLATLDEQRLLAFEEQTDLRLQLGDLDGLVEMLRDLLLEHGTRERLWGQLMTALARAGDVAGAAQAYAAARAELVERLGVEPGPDLREMHRAILNREPSLTDRSRRLPERVPTVTPHQLPLGAMSFVGRDAERRALTSARGLRATEGRPVVLTIDGPGGVGKSALALEVGRCLSDEHPDGQLYVDLQGARGGLAALSPSDALTRLVTALGGSDRGRIESDDLSGLWRSLSHGLRLLVILDNARDAEQVVPLLPNGIGCTVLVTSRRQLSLVDHTRQLTLQRLDDDEATRLLTTLCHGSDQARLGARGNGRPGSRVDDRSGAIARVAALCDGLPLALRMAAARLSARPDWGFGDLEQRLADDRHRLDELDAGDTGVRATFAGSYTDLVASDDAVDRDAARLLRGIGALPVPSYSVGVLAALADLDPVGVDHCIDRLLGLHLLSARADRWHVHDLLRTYAAEVARTHDDPTEAAAAVRRATWYLADATRSARLRVRPFPDGVETLGDPPLRSAGRWSCPSVEEAHRWFAGEEAALRALLASELLDPASALEIAHGLTVHDDIGGRHREQIAVAEDLITLAIACGDKGVEQRGWRMLAIGHQQRKDHAASREAIARAVAMAGATGDPVDEILTTNALGIFQTEWGEWDAAEQTLLDALGLARRLGVGHWIGLVLNSLGMFYRERGDLVRCIPILSETLALRRSSGDDVGEMHTLRQLGRAYAGVGAERKAMQSLDDALILARRLGAPELARYLRIDRMLAFAELGRTDRAASELQAALDLCVELDDDELTDDVLEHARSLNLLTSGAEGNDRAPTDVRPGMTPAGRSD